MICTRFGQSDPLFFTETYTLGGGLLFCGGGLIQFVRIDGKCRKKKCRKGKCRKKNRKISKVTLAKTSMINRKISKGKYRKVENIETKIRMKGVKGKHRMENIEKIKNDFNKMSILVTGW